MVDLLVIAPHPDDEVLGAGGIIAKFAGTGSTVAVLTVSGHMPPLYTDEVYQRTLREARKAHGILGVSEAVNLDYPATMLPQVPVSELNNKVFHAIDHLRPRTVLCPFPDRHLDHRAVFESAMIATRPKNAAGKNIETVAAYEVLSSTHWNAADIEPNFAPNWFVDVTDHIDQKVDALNCFESQIGEFPDPRSAEAVRALAMFRGSQAGFNFGEGFHIIRHST